MANVVVGNGPRLF